MLFGERKEERKNGMQIGKNCGLSKYKLFKAEWDKVEREIAKRDFFLPFFDVTGSVRLKSIP